MYEIRFAYMPCTPTLLDIQFNRMVTVEVQPHTPQNRPELQKRRPLHHKGADHSSRDCPRRTCLACGEYEDVRRVGGPCVLKGTEGVAGRCERCLRMVFWVVFRRCGSLCGPAGDGFFCGASPPCIAAVRSVER